MLKQNIVKNQCKVKERKKKTLLKRPAYDVLYA